MLSIEAVLLVYFTYTLAVSMMRLLQLQLLSYLFSLIKSFVELDL
jgi:hypothetical protein